MVNKTASREKWLTQKQKILVSTTEKPDNKIRRSNSIFFSFRRDPVWKLTKLYNYCIFFYDALTF